MSNLRKHKGYHGEVTYDEGKLVVRVLHVDDFLTGECQSAADAQRVFENLVDEYLEDCASIGREPKKPYSGTLNVRIGPDLHKAAAVEAQERGKSLNAWISAAVEEKLERSTESASAARQTAAILRTKGNVTFWENARTSPNVRTGQEVKMIDPRRFLPKVSSRNFEYN